MNLEIVFFFAVAAVAVLSAVMMITRPNPIMSVLFLIVNFFCLALLYLSLQAQFIAIVQIIVYAGAIMVLFLFVIMLLNLGNEKGFGERKSPKMLLAGGLVLAALLEILGAIVVPRFQSVSGSFDPAMGTTQYIGKILFTDYLIPFEITSMVLLAALVGVIVIAKKKFQ